MKKQFTILAIIGTLVLSQIAAAGDVPATFGKLTALAGKWFAQDENGKPMELEFEVTAAGSAVLEKGGDMLTVFTPDNGTFLMTHYCEAKNQPRLRAAIPSGDVDSLDFQFVDVSNAKAGEGHINHLTIKFVDKDHVTQIWGYGVGPATQGNQEFKLTRLR